MTITVAATTNKATVAAIAPMTAVGNVELELSSAVDIDHMVRHVMYAIHIVIHRKLQVPST